MRRWSPWLLTLLLPTLAGWTTGCKGGADRDPVLALSAAEALTQGKALLEQEKFFKARRFLTHAFEVAPNTALGREALLLAADTYYRQGGEANYVQAEAKYRDYLNRFPTSDASSYVQLQLGNCLAKRTQRPDRDQSWTEKALRAYEEVLRLYPTSEHAATAREAIREVRNRLAEHEFGVGKFYVGFGIYAASITRFTGLLERFPDYGERDKALFWLGRAFKEAEQPIKAFEVWERLRREYPESPYVEDIPPLELKDGKLDLGKVAENAAETEGTKEEASP